MTYQKKSHSIIIVAHKFLPQPDDDLVLFLNEDFRQNVLHIYHSFSDAPDRRSSAVWYKNGKEFRRFQTADYKILPEPFLYVKEMLFTYLTIFRTRMKWDRYVGMDGLCVFWGNGLRFLGIVQKTIYWAIDFVPEKRFSSELKNSIYQSININGYRHADEMWDLSPRMLEAREKYLDFQREDYRSHAVVPYGLWLDRIKQYPYEACDKDTLVFMGHLIEKQGVQLLINAISDIVRDIPHFKFKIIGTGSFKEQLMALAESKGVLKYCEFRGKIESNVELEDEIARSAVAIAPYVRSLDTWTYYADPGKVKSYLACGVPVILTNIPWNAKEIEKKQCGLIMSEEHEDIASKVRYLMQKENNILYRKNSKDYSRTFDYKNIFEQVSI